MFLYFILEFRTLLPLPGRDDEGKKVVLIRAAIHNPYQHKQDDVYKVCSINKFFLAFVLDKFSELHFVNPSNCSNSFQILIVMYFFIYCCFSNQGYEHGVRAYVRWRWTNIDHGSLSHRWFEWNWVRSCKTNDTVSDQETSKFLAGTIPAIFSILKLYFIIKFLN